MLHNVQLHKAGERERASERGDISRKRFTSGNAIGHVRHRLMFKQLPVIAVRSQRNVWFRFALLIQKDARPVSAFYVEQSPSIFPISSRRGALYFSVKTTVTLLWNGEILSETTTLDTISTSPSHWKPTLREKMIFYQICICETYFCLQVRSFHSWDDTMT